MHGDYSLKSITSVLKCLYNSSGGFFTMNHKVTDVSSALWQIYQEMDPCVLEEHVTQVRYSALCVEFQKY